MARIGPDDRLGSPLVTYSPEQLAEIDTLRARITELEGTLAEFACRVEQCVREEWNEPSTMDLVALTDDLPRSAQALTRLVEAGVALAKSLDEDRRLDSRLECCSLQMAEFLWSVDALLAARSGDPGEEDRRLIRQAAKMSTKSMLRDPAPAPDKES